MIAHGDKNQQMEFESKSLYFGGNSITYNLFEAKREIATHGYYGDLNFSLFVEFVNKLFLQNHIFKTS